MMIPVEKKSITSSDRKNMLNRYSMIVLARSTYRPMNWNPPEEEAEQARPEDGAAEQDHREPQPRAGEQRADVFWISRQRSRRKAAGGADRRGVGRDRAIGRVRGSRGS